MKSSNIFIGQSYGLLQLRAHMGLSNLKLGLTYGQLIQFNIVKP